MREPVPRDVPALDEPQPFVPFAHRVLPRISRELEDAGLKLSDGTARIILTALANGAHRSVAADYAGVHRATLHRWLHRDDEPYATFAKWCVEAEGHAELSAIVAVRAGMRDDPALALKYLERRYPTRWGRTLAEQQTNVQVNLTAMLERIEANARTHRDPRPPRPDRPSIIDAMRGEVEDVTPTAPLALPPADADGRNEHEGNGHADTGDEVRPVTNGNDRHDTHDEDGRDSARSEPAELRRDGDAPPTAGSSCPPRLRVVSANDRLEAETRRFGGRPT